jgi:hypothetical protein
MEKKLEIGAHVIYITPSRERVNALVEVIHSGEKTADEHKVLYGNWPCINLLFLSTDPAKVDPYGRQKERATSVSHGSVQGVPQGYCWLWPDEV